MNQAAAAPICPSCGAEVSPGLLACPGCNRLVHAAELSDLARRASEAEQAGEITEALGHWRAALELLPPPTNQFTAIQSQIERLGRQLEIASASTPPLGPLKGRSSTGKVWAGLGVVGVLIWKFKVLVPLVLTKGKLLLVGLTKSSTLLSMFAFFAAYWAAWGWLFALGLVLSLYIHEMGHVDALRRYGFKATAPMFIPGIGAFVRLRQHPANPSEDARIGLAGPLWGTAAAAACYLIHLATGAGIWAGLAHLGAIINLFNLMPLGSLDGGRGFRALSRHQAVLVTSALGLAWFFTGEAMILLVAIVAVLRCAATPKDVHPDRTACAVFLFLIASLSMLGCARGGV